MSATNDAVKQPAEVRLSHPPPPPGDTRTFQRATTDSSESPAVGLSLPSFVYMAVLITFLLLGIVGLRVITHRIQVRAATPPPVPAAATTSESPAQPTTDVTTRSTDPANPGATTLVVPPPPPPLRLQAVFYSPTKPSAIVSGSTVCVGDRVRGYHVVAIGKDSVTLSSPTETKVLRVY
jgi:hypothetical protein